MSTSDEAELRELIQRARALLESGIAPGVVFGQIAVLPDCRDAALAICVALRIPEAEAARRWAREVERLPESAFPPGAEEDLGWILEWGGFFDVHPELDARQKQIRALLFRAASFMGGIPSGYANSLERRLNMGRFGDAFISLAARNPRPTSESPQEYWRNLLAAAELLTDVEDEQFAPSVQRCRQMADATDGTDEQTRRSGSDSVLE